ncbi:MAG: response regulator [Leptospiraceae bacterium]|nr:response regulator [Leptospiraceae bacterium]MCP5510436.1 response regulator [Leptospiraceae bacterium]
MKKILIVDDSPVVRNFHMNILRKEGYAVEDAEDGVIALEKSLVNEYDLILCDINMPNMDGLTYVKKFRELEKETPVIIISTQEEQHQKIKGFNSGANLYIVKPVSPQKLINHIRLLLE